MKPNSTPEANMMEQLDKLQERFEQGQLMLTTILATMNEQMAIMERMVKNVDINMKQRAENIEPKISEEMLTMGHRLENIERKVNELNRSEIDQTQRSTLEFFDDQPVDDAAPKRKKIKDAESNVVDQEADGENRWRNYIKSMDIGGLKMFECTLCHKTGAQLSNLKTHVNGQHLGVVFTCDHCGHNTRCKQALVYHIERNHPQVKLACPHCQYTTVLASYLEYHLAHSHRGIPK